ncbi:hypothetical protein RND81_14G024100 [Saponaria officinalis]|uniref:Uncharacterized protein n=1 Tax=Saponaria officinalis TaxID=3572 RepID=A0AAW1GK60_SAPOF
MNKIYATNATNYIPIGDSDQEQPTEKTEIIGAENGNYEPTRSSSRRGQISMKIVSPLISRSVRARRRQAFLKTYQLSSVNDNSIGVATTITESKYGERVRDAAIKIKLAMVSLATAARLGFERRRSCFRPVVCA